jgi:hypothetical protein
MSTTAVMSHTATAVVFAQTKPTSGRPGQEVDEFIAARIACMRARPPARFSSLSLAPRCAFSHSVAGWRAAAAPARRSYPIGRPAQGAALFSPALKSTPQTSEPLKWRRCVPACGRPPAGWPSADAATIGSPPAGPSAAATCAVSARHWHTPRRAVSSKSQSRTANKGACKPASDWP